MGFLVGYSLLMIADFENGLTSRIFRFFLSGVLHRKTLIDLENEF